MRPSEQAFQNMMHSKGIHLDFIGTSHARRFALNKRFSLKGPCYKPDFHLPGSQVYYEVVGSRQSLHISKHKYVRFQQLYPALTLNIVKPNGEEIHLATQAEMDVMKTFSLPHYCKQKRISYPALADMLGVSNSYACQLRLGRKPMTLSIARKLSVALGKSLDEILG